MNSDLYPFADNYLDLNGLKYHYLDEGQGDPVVMVHGNPTWSFYYRELVKTLRPRYRTIVPDHIGCGLSDKPTDQEYEYTLERRVADLRQLIDHLQLDPVTLIVHDWGGMIGMAWATQHPAQVARIVVMNTAAFLLPSGKTFPTALMLARTPGLSSFLVRGLNGFCRGAVRFCMTRNKMEPEIAKAYLSPYDTWHNRIAVHRFVQDIPLHSSDRAYGLVTQTADHLETLRQVPMQIHWGMRDFVFDHHFLQEWQRRFPEAQVFRFEDAGHYVLEDASEDIIPLVERFIDQGSAEAVT